jgi:hypothetical protein
MKREDAREMAVGGLVKMQAGEHAALQDAAAYLNSQMRIEPDRNVFAGAGRIIHHIQWQHLLPQEASLWYYNSVTIKNIQSQRKKKMKHAQSLY